MNISEAYKKMESVVYSSSKEHLLDVLKLLDLKIGLEIHRFRTQSSADPFQSLKGLVITDAEVDILLGASDENLQNGEIQALTLEVELLNRSINAKVKQSRLCNFFLALDRLAEIFGLDLFEKWCVILCLAIEVDVKYEKLYAYLQDDVTRKKPTVDLALRLLEDCIGDRMAFRKYFSPDARLLRYILCLHDSQPGQPSTLLSKAMKLEDSVINFLMEDHQPNVSLEYAAQLYSCKQKPKYFIFNENQCQRISEYIRGNHSEEKSIIVNLYGPYGAGKLTMACEICRKIDKPLLAVDVGALAVNQRPLHEMLKIVVVEALLHQSVLCFQNAHVLLKDENNYKVGVLDILNKVLRGCSPLFILSDIQWKPETALQGLEVISLGVDRPDTSRYQELWLYHAQKYGFDNKKELDELAGKFRFTPGQIRDAFDEANRLACLKSMKYTGLDSDDINTACRMQSRGQLRKLCQKLDSNYTLDDLILPEEQLTQLRGICHQVKYKHVIFDEWGFGKKLSRGKGIAVLFSGPPGTGKTMAAEVISNQLKLDLYRIDLSQIVSKYIGETEKNLDGIFREAEDSNAILFFDEADALFGKRSEVKDAHDRYANIEIAYLLQKMEEYQGITILATNLGENMDEAFIRRLSFSIEFPFPSDLYREKIWSSVFPGSVPMAEDVDFRKLALKVKLPGGNIRNIALNASFLAVSSGSLVTMVHILDAAEQEYRKMKREWDYKAGADI